MFIRFRGNISAHSSIFHCNGIGDLLSFSFRSQYLYSTSATPAPSQFLVKYLIDSLGFSKQEAASTASRVTLWKSLKNPDSVLHFLKETGLDKAQMKKMVFKAPKLLFFDVSKTLKPKFQCLMDLGLFGPDLVNVIAKDATIIERGLVTHLRPVIDCLRSILGSDDNVVKALKRAPWLLTFGAHHIMETNLFLLRNFSFTDERIRKLVLRNPRYITQKPEWIKDLVHRVENDFRVPRDSPSFLNGTPLFSRERHQSFNQYL